MMTGDAWLATKTAAVAVIAAAALALMAAPHAFGQPSSADPPASAAPDPGVAKTQPPPGDPAQSAPRQVQLVFTPWSRYCAEGLSEKSSEIRTRQVCFTASDGHLPSGQKMVIALLIEPEEGGDARLLRVTLPLGVALVPGARIVIDEKEAMVAPFVVCLPRHGCMADYQADAGLIARLKAGRTLAIQAFDKSRPISFTLPLTDFAKAYDGPPGNPAGLDEQQKTLPNELPHAEDRLYTPRPR